MAVIRLSARQWARYLAGLAGETTRRLAARREALIVEHLPMCERIARKVARILPRHLEICDLVQDARVGLVQAADRYRPEDGSFSRFAYLRVRGSVIDSHKRRYYRDDMLESLEARAEWAARKAETAPVARAKSFDGVSYAHYFESVISGEPSPDEQAIENEKQKRLAAAIAKLEPEQRDILRRALAGELSPSISASYGRSQNWARPRIRAAVERVREEVA